MPTLIETGLGIGDISRLLGIADHTLRYWEKEFSDHLSPKRTTGRQRRYTDNDIATLKKIKSLLKDEGYSIRGARKILDGTRILGELEHRTIEDNFSTHDLAMRIAELVSTRIATAQVA